MEVDHTGTMTLLFAYDREGTNAQSPAISLGAESSSQIISQRPARCFHVNSAVPSTASGLMRCWVSLEQCFQVGHLCSLCSADTALGRGYSCHPGEHRRADKGISSVGCSWGQHHLPVPKLLLQLCTSNLPQQDHQAAFPNTAWAPSPPFTQTDNHLLSINLSLLLQPPARITQHKRAQYDSGISLAASQSTPNSS